MSLSGDVLVSVSLTQRQERNFWRKVNRDGPPHSVDPALGKCWLWTACGSPNGYGTFRLNGVQVMTHRLSFRIHHGPIPEGMLVMHSCNTRRCVNPAHLSSGTYSDNNSYAVSLNRHGTATMPERVIKKGEANGESKITSADVIRIRELYSSKVASQEKIGSMFGLAQTQVSRIIRRESWQHI